MSPLARLLRAILLLILSPLMLLAAVLALALTDLAWLLFGRRREPATEACRRDAASVVIPNWNGKELLEKYLPSVVEAFSSSAANEIIVVDNGSEDESCAELAKLGPPVRFFPSRKISAIRPPITSALLCAAACRETNDPVRCAPHATQLSSSSLALAGEGVDLR